MVAMTTREPTEAMRETALRAAHLGMGTDYAADARWARTLVAEIARALAEQDTATRREGHAAGFAEAREMAAKVARRSTETLRPWIGDRRDDLLYSALREGQEVETAIRALTPPEPPSEKETPKMTDEQIKHMVNRFLGWKLPENFRPDAGISFKATFNDGTPYEMKHNPSGTNLFDAAQAEEMVRFMIEGLPSEKPAPQGQE